MVTVYTFGDSILDCGHYNGHGVHPGGLLVRNDDTLFPGFRGQDLSSRGAARLVHRAVDGARVDGLPAQVSGVAFEPDALVLVTVGGNDLLGGLVADPGPGIERFRQRLDAFLRQLPPGRVLLGNVYDPSGGDDARNFLPLDPSVARGSLARMNAALADLAARHGALVDVHGHFLRQGDPSWFSRVIEPSLVGASEVRRAFLPHAMALAARIGAPQAR